MLEEFVDLGTHDTRKIVWIEESETSGEATAKQAGGKSAEEHLPSKPKFSPRRAERPSQREADGSIRSPDRGESESVKYRKDRQRKAFELSREAESEFVDSLTEAGLGSHSAALGKAGITSLKALQAHSVDELEESLKRPIAYGKRFSLSKAERRLFLAMGMCSEPTPEPTKPTPAGSKMLRAGSDVESEASATQVLGSFAPAKAIGAFVEGEHLEVGGLFEGSPLAARLFGSAGPGLGPQTLTSVLDAFARAVDSSASTAGPNDSAVELVDKLDLVFESLVKNGRLDPQELKPELPGIRAATKHAMKIAVRVEQAGRVPPKDVDTSSTKNPSDGSDLARALLQSQAPRLSQQDEKVAAELSASQSRLDSVLQDAKLRSLVESLRDVAQSSKSDLEKLDAFKAVACSSAKVAELLKSSHVRDPKGELALNSHAKDLVDAIRATKNGLGAAAKSALRRFLPPTADTALLVEACAIGQLVSTTGGFTVHKLADAKTAKPWLSIKAATTGDNNANSRANLLSVQLLAMPVLQFALTMLQPEDPTVGPTMTDVQCTMAKAVSRRPVAEAVDSVLVPFLRSYGEAFDAFQKSSSMALPCMADVWAKEKVEPAMASFLQLVASGAPSSESSTSSGGASKELKELKSQLERQQRELRAIKKAASASDDEGGKAETAELTEEERAARKAKNKKSRDAQKERRKKNAADARAFRASQSGDEDE
jgi:hypothetical protein